MNDTFTIEINLMKITKSTCFSINVLLSEMALANALWNANFTANFPLHLASCLNDYSQDFCMAPTSRPRRSPKKSEPVIFLPQTKPKDCEDEQPSMSAFGFLSFAMAVTNGVINAANNINNVSIYHGLCIMYKSDIFCY